MNPKFAKLPHLLPNPPHFSHQLQLSVQWKVCFAQAQGRRILPPVSRSMPARRPMCANSPVLYRGAIFGNMYVRSAPEIWDATAVIGGTAPSSGRCTPVIDSIDCTSIIIYDHMS